MRVFLSILSLIICMSAYAQPSYEKFKDTNTGDLIYKGYVTFDDLQKEQAFTWFKNGADNYTPNEDAVKDLKKSLPAYDLVVLMGTWCDDSHIIIPKLYKTLLGTGYPVHNVTMYGLDREKKGANKEEEQYKVFKVPTIIILSNGKEIGRITETTQVSVEADLLKMVDNSQVK